MSKITSKNLSYDTSLPPFLARLQQSSNTGERNEIQHARPKKLRSAEDEAEDEPVFFDEESGETLTKKEWEEKETAKEKEQAEAGEDNSISKEGKEKIKESKEKVAAIGASRKRKLGKVVGGDEADLDITKVPKASRAEGGKSNGDSAKGEGKAAKKGKKVKLSFGDED